MKKVIPILAIILGFVLLSELMLPPAKAHPPTSYGVSFSPRYATFLGLDYRSVYKDILDNLKVRNFRLNSFWDILEPTEGKYDFSQNDYLISEAQKRDAHIILVVGQKQPRWPECHLPDWARSLDQAQREQKILQLIEKIVLRYKDNPAIEGWQVENEPLFGFGENCYPPDEQFLASEVDLVKKLDPSHPIIMTDSGEWGWWVKTAQLSDYQGISMYRKAYNTTLNRYITHPFPGWFYSLKYQAAKIFAPHNQKLIVTELQTEPWFKDEIHQTPGSQQVQNYSLADFEDSINTANSVRTDQIYLWGVEWWYYIKDQGHPEYLDRAKSLFNF